MWGLLHCPARAQLDESQVAAAGLPALLFRMSSPHEAGGRKGALRPACLAVSHSPDRVVLLIYPWPVPFLQTIHSAYPAA